MIYIFPIHSKLFIYQLMLLIFINKTANNTYSSH